MSTTDTGRVLVADDQADVLEALRILLKAEGFEVATVNSPRASFPVSSKRTSTRS